MSKDKGRGLIPGETIWSVATGAPRPWLKASRKAVDYMAGLDGFVGVHMVPNDGRLLWFFETRDAAVRGRNLAKAQGIECGTNIGEWKVAADGVPEHVDGKAVENGR